MRVVRGPGLALASVMFAAGGGGSSAGAQFCRDWASAYCAKLYACTPADMRGADFLGGSSQAECNTVWGKSCSDAPPAGETFDVNCSGGAHVNTAAKMMCLD